MCHGHGQPHSLCETRAKEEWTSKVSTTCASVLSSPGGGCDVTSCSSLLVLHPDSLWPGTMSYNKPFPPMSSLAGPFITARGKELEHISFLPFYD